MQYLKTVQDRIGYQFCNENLLKQAFIRKSYSMENGGENNEVLEFIGDKALDISVIKIMIEKFQNKSIYFKTTFNEGKLTELKTNLVEKKALSRSMDYLGFHNFLLMGKGDYKKEIQNEDSVKEDLFESIIGAVTLDCNWNISIISKVVQNMINFDAYFNNDLDLITNYIGFIQEWSQKNEYGLPIYEYECIDSTHFICKVKINTTSFCFEGKGESKDKARMDACKNGYFYLKNNGYIKNKYCEAVGKFNHFDSLKQVHILIQKKLIDIPKYEFIEINDGWKCKMIINDKIYYSINQNKKEAQKDCAYKFLKSLN